MASSEAFVGSINIWPAGWAPEGWALCNGQLLPISSYEYLHSLIGVTYGGNNINTFALPDLKGRVPVGMGLSAEGTDYKIAQTGGVDFALMSTYEMPFHCHTAAKISYKPKARIETGEFSNDPDDKYPVKLLPDFKIYSSGVPKNTMAENKIAVGLTYTGNDKPFSTVQPFLVVNYIMALNGLYPLRD